MTNSDTAVDTASATERRDLLDTLRKHRGLFKVTIQGLSDDQARLTPTASELSLGGLVKHVAATEASWLDFIEHGPAETPTMDWDSIDWSDPPAFVAAYRDGFRLLEDETLTGALATYDEVTARTDALLASVHLDECHPLPAAPWFDAGASWSNRRVFLHIVAETTQHAGHADIIRETIDGQKSMG
jgi:uncharacterized damage-inducible protein DinB